MLSLRLLTLSVAASIAFALGSLPVSATTIVYDSTNVAGLSGWTWSPDAEVGDEITLVGSAREVIAIQTRVVLYSSDGDEAVIVRLYANNGPSGAPGTELWSSAPQPISLGENTLNLTSLSVLVPGTVIWTLESVGLSLGDDLSTWGEIEQSPATGSYVQTWSNVSGNWESIPTSLTSYFKIQAIPEPSTALLLACGLAGLAAAGRRRSLH